MLKLKVIAKIKALCQANRQLHFGVTVQTKQGHDSAWRDFSTTYCGGRIFGRKANISLYRIVHIHIMECHC